MSCPTEGIESTAFGNNIDIIKETIERRHSIHYTVYNLSNKIYHKEKFTKVNHLHELLEVFIKFSIIGYRCW
jgi:hypothetical protein